MRFRRLFVFATRRRRSRIFHPIVELALSILCWQSIAVAQTQVHHHHGSEGIPPEVIEKLGTVQMPISCAASTSTTFERGVAMLHSFWYEEARKEFTSVATTDPSCAMAQWGLAMTEWRPFWDGMPEDRRREGIAEIDRALALAPKADRERRYITALSGYLHGDSAHDDLALASYVNAMGALHRAYPDDVEAHAFYGLALAAAANGDSKDPIGADRKALAVLELGFKAHPDHPGLHTISSTRVITLRWLAKLCRQPNDMPRLLRHQPMRSICRGISSRD